MQKYTKVNVARLQLWRICMPNSKSNANANMTAFIFSPKNIGIDSIWMVSQL